MSTDIDQALALQNVNPLNTPERVRDRPPHSGLLTRAQSVLEEVTKQEEMIQSLLSRVRGSNVSHLDPVKEPAPAGLPSIYDQLERRQKNMTKLIHDLSEMF
jgi:hypothetical protein